ncbi:MAG: SpoVR family protein [Herpetosiphonaceae bacterium]|nr:SpoVR family protein [Herpetosiphonaceae bacterium]
MPLTNNDLPPQLNQAWAEIDGHARSYGLDYHPIIYQVLDYKTLYEVAAMGGFPTRYPHWRFGMEYDQLIKGHVYGLSIIYEMVINTNPVYAYLLEGNMIVDQKTVMAHVAGHADFFKNNMWFAPTNRKMLDMMANHAARIQRYIDRYGYEVVESFIDTCLSLDNLIDYHAPYIKRLEAQTVVSMADEDNIPTAEGLPVERPYMKDYINPPDFMEHQRQVIRDEQQRMRKFPENPQKDILLFLMNYAPLERWQHSVLDMIRDEAYYFAPQAMTKVLNEGHACAVAGTLLYTDQGLRPIEAIVENREALLVSDGETPRRIFDWMTFEDRETVFIRTKRGLELEGSTTHRLMLPDGLWRRMDELNIGDRLLMGAGQNRWPEEYVQLNWQTERRLTWSDVAERAGVNPTIVNNYRRGISSQYDEVLAPLVMEYETAVATRGMTQKRRTPITVPTVVDESLASFMGYLVGDGHISSLKRTIGLTTGDDEQADQFIELTQRLFGLECHKRWDPNRWRISFSSRDVVAFLKHLGMKTGVAARIKAVPDVILRSPKSVVAAFLRAYYDCDGYAGEAGVILSTSSEQLSKQTQLLLLNFGILSQRRPQKDGCWHVHTMGKSAAIFQQEIGFGLERKQEALRRYVDDHHWFKKESWTDQIVGIERRRATVYDISVEETHRYAAQGFINHNSYWHSKIMTTHAADTSEIVDFADHHAGIVAAHPGRLNPYRLGLLLLRDIEDRWNKGRFGKEWEECTDLREKQAWDRKLGLGRQKLFEVRRFHNDVTFLDEFLTPEFCVENKLFTFKHNNDTDLYEIVNREFKDIKAKLLGNLTNFGQPFIYVEDANYNNRTELYLRHRHEGVDLKMDYARDTMKNIFTIWTRPVNLETVVDDKRRLLSFDGHDFTDRKLD